MESGRFIKDFGYSLTLLNQWDFIKFYVIKSGWSIVYIEVSQAKIFKLHYILKAKSNFTLLLYIHFLGIGEWYFKCV